MNDSRTTQRAWAAACAAACARTLCKRTPMPLGLLVFLLVNHASSVIAAQAPRRLTVLQSVDLALRALPAVHAASERAAAADARVGLARVQYLPRTDLLFEETRSTRNNVSGLLPPQGVLPAISGPVQAGDSSLTRYGSAAGVLVAWEPFDFGLRRASVELARRERTEAARDESLERLSAAGSAADAFLAALAAGEVEEAQRSNVERMQAFTRSVEALASAGMRAGADASRARAELARARTRLIEAEESRRVALAALAAAIGQAGCDLACDAGALARPPIEPEALPKVPAQGHPRALVSASRVDAAAARRRVVEVSARPRVHLVLSASDRGSGFLADGSAGPPGSGLGPDVPNVAAGLAVTYGLTDLAERRVRRRIEAHEWAARRADYDQTIQDLSARQVQARAVVDTAGRVAENTPIQLAAARDTVVQVTARYAQGLATVSDVAEAQSLLLRSQIDDDLARLGVWRALLGQALASGDLSPWLDRVRRAGPLETR